MKYLVIVSIVLLTACSKTDERYENVVVDKSYPAATDMCKSHGGLERLSMRRSGESDFESCGWKCSKLSASYGLFKATCADKFEVHFKIQRPLQ